MSTPVLKILFSYPYMHNANVARSLVFDMSSFANSTEIVCTASRKLHRDMFTLNIFILIMPVLSFIY